MRRPLAGLLLFLAGLSLGIAVTGWWVQRTILDPDISRDVAAVVLEDSAVRDEVSGAIADAAAEQLGQDPDAVRSVVDQAVATGLGADLLVDVVADAHARLVGASDAPVVIDPATLPTVLSSTEAAALQPVVLPVPRVAALAVAREGLDRIVPIAALGALVLAILGAIAHPDRTSVLRSVALGLLVAIALVAVVGYLLPVYVVPRLSSSGWAEMPGDLARDSANLLIGLGLVGLGLAGLALVAAGLLRR